MATISRHFGYQEDTTQPVPSGFTRIGALLIASSTNTTPGGLDTSLAGHHFYNGPDESVNANMPIIAYTVRNVEGTYLQFNTLGDQGTDGNAGTEGAWIAFKRLSKNTNAAFIEAVEAIATLNQDPQNFSTADEAATYLSNAGAARGWTNFTTQVDTTTAAPGETLYFVATNCGEGQPFYVQYIGNPGAIAEGYGYQIDYSQNVDPFVTGDAVHVVSQYTSALPESVYATILSNQVADCSTTYLP